MNKKSFFLIVPICFLFFSINVFAGVELTIGKGDETGFSIISKDEAGMTAVSTIGKLDFENRLTDEGGFTTVSIDGLAKNHGDEGKPQLPVITRLIEIPYAAQVEVKILSETAEDISLAEKGFSDKLMPTQPSVSKDIDQDQAPFSYNKTEYQKDEFNDDELVTVTTLGVMRGVTLARLRISPLRYNPSQNSLKVYSEIKFELTYVGGDTDYTQILKRKYRTSSAKAVLSSIETLPESSSDEKSVAEDDDNWPLTYAIVADDSFNTGETSEYDIEDFIRWKSEEGYNVEVLYTDDSESDSTLRTTIKSFLEGLDPLPTYVLLVGDEDLVPAYDGEEDDHVTDLYYCTFDGSGDDLPDAFYGRFPADDADDLAAMVEKTLLYEKYEFDSSTDTSYLDNSVFVAGADTSYAAAYGDAQVRYAVNEYYPDAFKYLYSYNSSNDEESSTGITSALIAHINGTSSENEAGVGFFNYTGHCGEEGLHNGVTDVDELDNDDISSLSNEETYGLAIANCCLSNRFDYDDCFGEEMFKVADKGVIGYIGGTNSTYWDEDFYWAVGVPELDLTSANSSSHTTSNTGTGAYDGLWHTTSDTSDQEDWYITSGQIIYQGNLAVEGSDSTRPLYYWEIYHLMGDPSLMPYLSEPDEYPETPSVADADDSGRAITSCVTARCEISDIAEYSYVALSQNGELLDSAYSGENTSVLLEFEAIDSTDDLTLVVRKQNYQPYNDTITVIAGAVTAPVADFSFDGDNVYSGSSVSFTNLSAGCGNTYNWVFGGGADDVNDTKNPDVEFDKMGSFDVTLTASNTLGTDFKTSQLDILPKIAPSTYTGTLNDGTCSITFSELSSNHSDVSSWAWTFTDASDDSTETSTDESPALQISAAGSYSAKLTVTIDGTEYTSNTVWVTIKKAVPEADFTMSASTVTAGGSIQFTNASLNDIDRYSWTFEDGTPAASNEENPEVYFNTAGEDLKVVLKVVNSTGSDSKIQYITVNESTDESGEKSSSSGGGCFIRSLD